MEFFMQMSEQEQRLRLDVFLPTIDEFWAYCLGSSAVGVFLAVNECMALKVGNPHLSTGLKVRKCCC